MVSSISEGLAGTTIEAALGAGEVVGAELGGSVPVGMYGRSGPLVFSLDKPGIR